MDDFQKMAILQMKRRAALLGCPVDDWTDLEILRLAKEWRFYAGEIPETLS